MPPIPLRKYFLLLALAWSATVATSLGWNLVHNSAAVRSITVRTAQALLEKDLLYREWSILHGGVYIPKPGPPGEGAPERDGERDIVTPSGQHLTLLNPAVVSREIFDLQSRQLGIRGHITSLDPIRPSNGPDPWERRALEAFASGAREISGIDSQEGISNFRMMRPLVTVPSCLRCHEEQGQKPGSIRGGISVTVPMSRFAERDENLHLAAAHLGLWMVGVTGLVIGRRSLEHQSRQRARAQDALNYQHDLTCTLTQNATTAIFLLDPQGRCTLMNPAAEAMTGYKFDEVESKHLHELIHNSSRNGATPAQSPCAFLMAAGELRTLRNHEDVFYRKDGTAFPVLCAASPVSKNGVLTGVVIEAQDITDRKLAEERMQTALREKEALLQEIHHRVKNNLQIISSLLQLQINEMKDPQTLGIFRESQFRVRSMALIHEKLYESDSLARIDLADYLRSLTHLLFSTYAGSSNRVRLELNLSPAFVSIDAAIPLGLIANELITNSLKFAFPDDRKGCITVEIGSLTNGRFRFRVADDGVGFPEGFEVEKTRSLGVRLVRMLTSQLGGDGTWDTDGAGAAFTLQFPDAAPESRLRGQGVSKVS